MDRQVGDEAAGDADQLVDAVRQAIRGDFVHHRAPDALRQVVLVPGVLGQPEESDPPVICVPVAKR